jgi:hypothetical protein
MFQWLREFREVWREKAPCDSCEVLKAELSNERREKQRLLDSLLAPKPVEPERLEAPEPKVPIGTRHIPWKVRQQMLEQADREKAQLLAEFKKKDAEIRGAAKVPAEHIEGIESLFGVVKEQ